MDDVMTEMRIPERFDMGQAYQTVLSRVLYQRKATAEEPGYYNPLNRRTVMGFVVPDWQRPLVWTDDQKIRFIESLWLGMPVGTYTINVDGQSSMETPNDLRNIIVDGQQRMKAIEDYIEGRFRVFGLLYSELTKVELRRFANIHFSSYETHSSDEDFIREYYNRMNFGGTPHTDDQRA